MVEDILNVDPEEIKALKEAQLVRKLVGRRIFCKGAQVLRGGKVDIQDVTATPTVHAIAGEGTAAIYYGQTETGDLIRGRLDGEFVPIDYPAPNMSA